MIWREKRILLIILALVLAANTMFFFTYRVQYQSRLDTLDERLAQVEADLEQARMARIRDEQTLQSYRKVENDVLEVFNEHWSTQPARFTKLFGEVTRLAMASSLVPSSYSFKRGEAKRISAGGPRQNLGANEVGMQEAPGTEPPDHLRHSRDLRALLVGERPRGDDLLTCHRATVSLGGLSKACRPCA